MDPEAPILAPRQSILTALRGLPEGARSRDLQQLAGLKEMGVQAFRRILLRLVVEGTVKIAGLTKDRRYFLAEAPGAPSQPEVRAEVAVIEALDGYPALSPEAQACREVLALPLIKRKPVTYQRAFLDAYVPNGTFYLPKASRDHLASLGRPMDLERPVGTYARQIFQRLLIDLSWNSSRLEGNTYSLLDTEKLIELGKSAEGKDSRETTMILNHKAAIEYLVASAEEIAPDPVTIRNLHALLVENLLGDPLGAGVLRTAPVGIHGTTYLPTAVPQILDESFRQILHAASDILDPFEQAFFMLVHIPYLQPFIDGNKRTARLAANIPFIRLNCIPITFMDLPSAAFTDGLLAIYEQNRIELFRDVFVYAYERSCIRFNSVRGIFGEPDPFRVRYRNQVKAVVREAVLAGESIPEAKPRVRAFLEAELPREDWSRFTSAVETELASLHDGNYARFQLRPSEFQAWLDRTQPRKQ